MKYDIIHIYLSMMIGLACAASCTSDRDSLDSLAKEEMTFEVGNLTRTSATTNSNLKERPFQLFGDMNRTGEYYPGLKELFNAQTVKFENNKWDYGTPLYWLMGQEHSFVAVHPHSDFIPGMSDLTYSNSKVSFTYTIPTDEYNATDILVATHRRKYTLDTPGAVKFGFKHILSRINIEPALDEVLMYEDDRDKENHPYNKDEYIQFRRIEIYSLKTKASFSFTPASLQTGNPTDKSVATYELDDNSVADIKLSFTNPKEVTNNKTNVNIVDDDNALLVLPQSIDKDAKIILFYTVNRDHNNDHLIRTITFPLSDLPIDKWEQGKSYTYKFTIEKAYTGQIREGSLEWVVTDITDASASDKWINEDGTITQNFETGK